MQQSITGLYEMISKWIAVPFFCLLFLFLAFSSEKDSDTFIGILAAFLFLLFGISEKLVSIDIAKNEIHISGYIRKRKEKLTDIVDVKEIIPIQLSSVIRIKFKNNKSATFSVLSGRYLLMPNRKATQPRAVKTLLSAARLANDMQEYFNTTNLPLRIL